MSGLNKILEQIISDSLEKAEAVIREAEQEAQRIAERAAEEAASAAAQRQGEAEKEAKRARERVIGNAKMEAGKALLRVRQEMLTQCFQKVYDTVYSMPLSDYEELLTELIAGAADGGEAIVLSQRDQERISLLRFLVAVNSRLKREGLDAPGLTMSEDVMEEDCGFLLKKGEVTTNCSLSALLAAKRESLEISLSKILFEE